ncbi:MAG: radical SAM family heme chaperone HemW [Lachnospiraceae bacterium]
MMIKELSIYIHIPFCVRKCLYCDFLSFPENEQKENYVNQLIKEIKEQSILYKNHRVISVFIGGGTPSILAAGQISMIMEAVYAHYQVSDSAELSIEMNPGTVTQAKLGEYITCGINRISIGLQSANDEELVRIGRIHDYETFLETYHMARAAGFRNINIDLMSALPDQSMESYQHTLERVVALEPEHISAYSLILEEGTPLYEHQDSYTFPSEDEDREMYLWTGRYLAEHGYHRYEISNYAREGYECRHNKVYWQRGDYVGFGLGAASMVEDCRWSNPSEWEEYAAYVGQAQAQQHDQSISPVKPVRLKQQKLSVPEQMEEFMFLGLRMMCGIEKEAFGRKFGQQIEEVYGSVLQNLEKQGLLAQDQNRVWLTERGIDISNYVMAQFLFE